jgi:hypothetical protein
MNILEWMQQMGYIKRRMASIYISNYDGTESEQIKNEQKKYNLPEANVRFGDYNTTSLTKDNEIFFWTTTSTFNWTVDLFEL